MAPAFNLETSMNRTEKITMVFRTDIPNRFIKAWISHNAESKSYRLTVVPVERRWNYTDGTVTESIKAYSGYTVFVEDAPRFSRKRLEALAADLKVLERVVEMAALLGGTDVV